MMHDIQAPKESNIKACRFCGVVPKVRTVFIGDKKVYELKCLNQYCASNNQWSRSMDEIIQIWNDGTAWRREKEDKHHE